MAFAERFEKTFKQLLPSPFSIALGLTVLAFCGSLIFSLAGILKQDNSITSLAESWYNGLWNGPLMVFAMQMMLMLVLGHVLALSQPVNWFISAITKRINDNASAAFWVTLLTLLVAFFNWGLGLIFGAIFARKIGEASKNNNFKINYPLIGAAGYSGLMIWHGGLSGSAPIKANDAGHITEITKGAFDQSQYLLPDTVSISSTVFGSMNVTTSILLLIFLPIFMWLLGKKISTKSFQLKTQAIRLELPQKPKGAEKMDHNSWISTILGVLMLTFALYMAINSSSGLSFLNPNFINFSLFGLCLLLHQNIIKFLASVDDAIGGAAGILIQFPLYFGIMGIMKESGMVTLLSSWFSENSTTTSFPVFTFISSGIINIFVPSGGGQWAVQAPILIQSAMELNVPLSKAIMSLAYGDQLTNMLQPFWALPLLGITGLKAKEILPYTLLLMLIGSIIFICMLLLF